MINRDCPKYLAEALLMIRADKYDILVYTMTVAAGMTKSNIAD